MALDYENGICVYKGCSKSNTSCFMIMTGDVRGEFGGMTAEAEPSCQYPITFCCHGTDDSRGSDKMASDMNMWMEQQCGTESLHVEQMTPTDVHKHSQNIYGDPTVNMRNGRCLSVVVTATVVHLCWCRFVQEQLAALVDHR